MAHRRRSALTPEYDYDTRLKRYVRRDTGRLVSAKVVRAAIDNAVENSQREVRRLSQQLREGRISLATWQTRMAEEIKMIHLGNAAIARGGWSQLTQADFGRIGGQTRRQYGFLRNFAQQIEAGTQRLDGTLNRRADLYAQAGRTTFHAFSRLAMVELGFDEERNVLSVAEHCAGCLAETARDWVPVGSLVPIGQRDCMTNDRCSIEYRNSETGESRLV